MPAQMTMTARRQGWKNGIISVVVFLIAVLLLEEVLALTTGKQGEEVRRIAFAMAWGFFLLFSLARWIYGRSIAGRMLLDCGPIPAKWLYLVLGFVVGLLCCEHPASVFSVDLWFSISFAVFFLVAAFGRLQVRENGIMQYWSLLRWEKIASYCWAEDSTLLLKQRSRFSLRAALSVPPEQRQAVDEFLTRFCRVPRTPL